MNAIFSTAASIKACSLAFCNTSPNYGDYAILDTKKAWDPKTGFQALMRNIILSYTLMRRS
ncbi:MAG: hypothetical protein LKI04_04075 [Paenibacillus lautus]|jgi:hypothetical protein|uniref:hypothetical protein n=1 Tax=Paenibacillus lautus TaxID=1401 RepID=UPI0026ED4C9C|nr:hypothetical protein [Paenibacillus lautus]MCI1773156.1 hypothetical protein [Paenibacillus lautus]